LTSEPLLEISRPLLRMRQAHLGYRQPVGRDTFHDPQLRVRFVHGQNNHCVFDGGRHTRIEPLGKFVWIGTVDDGDALPRYDLDPVELEFEFQGVLPDKIKPMEAGGWLYTRHEPESEMEVQDNYAPIHARSQRRP